MAPVNSKLLSYCADGTQIFRSYVQDGVRHCPDGSDEMVPDVSDLKIQEKYEDIVKRLEEVEEKSFWTWLLDVLDRALPILNSVILFSCGGKKMHIKYKRRQRPQHQPAAPSPPPLLI